MRPIEAERLARRAAWMAGVALLLLAARWLFAAPAEDAADFPVVTLDTPAGSLQAALADDPRRRGMGYRAIAADRAPAMIYFRYPSPRRVTFDMGSVRFPVRAYWIGEDHCIAGWSDMQPGDGGHKSPVAVMAVLEVALVGEPDVRFRRGDCIREQ